MQPLSHTTNDLSLRGCAREILDAVPPVIWFVRKEMRRHRKGLSMPQLRTLTRVDTQPNMSLSAVAEHLGASRSSTSRTVAGLVNKGLLTRQDSSDDRRQLVLTLTQKGRTVMDEVWAATQRRTEVELQGLNTAQLAAVINAMEILKKVFGSVGPSQRTCACDGPPRPKSARASGVKNSVTRTSRKTMAAATLLPAASAAL